MHHIVLRFSAFSCAVLLIWLSLCRPAFGVPVVRYRMVEDWRVVEDDEAFLFGEIEDLTIDASGEVFVLDSQLANVKVFSRTGRYLRTMGTAGDGPGEVRSPGDVIAFPDGTLGLISKLNWKIARIDRETGEPAGDMRVLGPDGRVTVVQEVKPVSRVGRGETLVALVREMGTEFWHWRMSLGLYRDVGDGADLLPERILCEVGEATGADVEEEEYFAIWEPWTVDSLGRTVVAPYWGSYTLRWYGPDGELAHEVELPHEPRARTGKEKLRLLEKVWGGRSPEEFGIDLVLSDTEAVVRRIHARPDGRLWIRTCDSAHEVGAGVFRVYDVVGPDGALEARAEIHGRADDLVDRVHFGPDDMMVIVHGAERYVQNHRGRKPDGPEYDLFLAGYRLERIPDE